MIMYQINYFKIFRKGKSHYIMRLPFSKYVRIVNMLNSYFSFLNVLKYLIVRTDLSCFLNANMSQVCVRTCRVFAQTVTILSIV